VLSPTEKVLKPPTPKYLVILWRGAKSLRVILDRKMLAPTQKKKINRIYDIIKLRGDWR